MTGSGYSDMTYRPFTLEGNFLAMEAVHEMLLQRWSADPGSGSAGVVRLFPATPWRWHTAFFENLRAEGGHKVSARRENNATTWFRIVAGHDGLIRVRDNFGGRVPRWNCKGVKQAADNFEIEAKAGQSIEATLPALDEIPTPPANLAVPVEIRRK